MQPSTIYTPRAEGLLKTSCPARKGLPRGPQMPVGAKPQPLGAIVEALCGYADQVLWIGESARQSGEVEPPLVEEAGETARKARRPAAELRKEIEAHWDRHFRGGSR